MFKNLYRMNEFEFSNHFFLIKYILKKKKNKNFEKKKLTFLIN
jgi:hypothetical protein